jgi:hypothetical protein
MEYDCDGNAPYFVRHAIPDYMVSAYHAAVAKRDEVLDATHQLLAANLRNEFTTTLSEKGSLALAKDAVHKQPAVLYRNGIVDGIAAAIQGYLHSQEFSIDVSECSIESEDSFLAQWSERMTDWDRNWWRDNGYYNAYNR